MRMYDIIMKKRNGESLSKDEIEYFVNGYCSGEIPDYQASALLMAIYFKKMNKEETFNLTMAMERSGDELDLSGISGIKVDKHSTGGVGDKTTLVVAPMVAAAGVKIAKMSGRGLGHTGGTIDKLESFKGFSTALSEEEFIKQVNDLNIAITGQTGNLAPADKKIYALRDVTATVENISLIASSIMSKKLASGADRIVLDVKTGSGAFMKNEDDAFALAKEMVDIGTAAGRKTIAVVTAMDQPLGKAVGNALEVKEAIDTLNGEGPSDLHELCLVLGTYMLLSAHPELSENEARAQLEEVIKNKKALDMLARMVEAQGGNKFEVYDYSTLPAAKIVKEVFADTDAKYVKRIHSDEIGRASMILGGGRNKKGDSVDLSVGIILNKKIGDCVNDNEPIAFIHGNDERLVKEAEKVIADAYEYTDDSGKICKSSLIKGVIK